MDRAALDVAIALGLPHGGFVPKGRLAEDGPLPTHYQMTELASAKYEDRTRANVDQAEATLVFFRERISGGTLLTWEYAKSRKKPTLLINLAAQTNNAGQIKAWLQKYTPDSLNIAGPRESTHPGIYTEARSLLEIVLK